MIHDKWTRSSKTKVTRFIKFKATWHTCPGISQFSILLFLWIWNKLSQHTRVQLHLHFFDLGHAVLPDLYICKRNTRAPRTNHLPQSKNVVSCRLIVFCSQNSQQTKIRGHGILVKCKQNDREKSWWLFLCRSHCSRVVIKSRADSSRSSQSKVNQFAFKTYQIHMQYPTKRMRAIYKSISVNSFLKIFWYSPTERNLVIEFYIIFLQKMCTFDEQKLNKTESKGHVHIMCRCVNYNTINNICVYRAVL